VSSLVSIFVLKLGSLLGTILELLTWVGSLARLDSLKAFAEVIGYLERKKRSEKKRERNYLSVYLF